MNKTLYLLVVLPFFSCGDSDSMALNETFRADTTLTSSIFSITRQSSGATETGDFFLKVVSSGVSSGFVKLNDDELLGPSDFKNKSFEETFPVDLFETNTIELEVRGSPGDQLCARVYELNSDDTERGIFEGCVDRKAGPPNNVEVVITPTPTPTPTP